ncbi:MAG TPA: carboxypeptidase-like regulatory domain-containing protein, partial [Blastocatellia bacterium]|nr:carboxypeptidase-like regulatory domain-containing protein [Blastocatellia bacterium]
MSKRSGVVVVLGIVILLGCSVQALCQASATVAQLNGAVRDANGAVIVGANLTLREVDTNRRYSASSNEDGLYLIPNLPPGKYDLTVNYTGFGKSVSTGIVLTVGQTATLNVTLSPTLEQSVTVTGETPIEPTRTETSQVINPQQIQNLPVSGRLFTDFALLTPGVATGRTSLGTTFTEFEITQISFGGMRSFSNLITVDGADFINSN